MGNPYLPVVEDPPDLADMALIEERVTSTATAVSGLDEPRDLGVFVRDSVGQVVAGVSGLTWAGYCELHAMWVAEHLRGRGLARALMAEAEAEARRRGCEVVAFIACDMLTPGMYERLGYETVGSIDDRYPGGAIHWYRKDL